MLSAIALDSETVAQVEPAAPAPPLAPAAPAPALTPATPAPAPPASPGETLDQAEQAVRELVAQGMTGAAALAAHPLPPGTPTATALDFLASLPQTTYAIDSTQGTVTGPPLAQPPAAAPDGADAGVEETTLKAYKPPGIVAKWRDLIDVFKVTAPSQQAQVQAIFDNPKEFWK